MGAVRLGELVARRRHRDLAILVTDPDRFHARFQPIVALDGGATTGFEALLRASDADGAEIGAVDLSRPRQRPA